MTSLPQLNPNAAGQWHRPRRASTAPRSASTSSGRPSSRSPWRWRWTPASSSRSGQMYSCPGALHVAGRTINDTHPFNRACSVAEIMMESSNIGTAQIARQLGATRQKEFLDKMGFLDQVEVELKRARPHADPGQELEPGRDDDRRLRPRHRGHPAPPRLAAMRPCSTAASTAPRRCSRSTPGTRSRRAAACSARTPATRCARCCGWSSPRAPARRPTRPATASAARPAPRRNITTARSLVTSFAGVFPMDEPRYVIVVMLDEPKATAETYGFRTAGWNVAPVVSRTVSRIAPMLGVRPDKKREPNMAEVLPYRARKGRAKARCGWATLRGRCDERCRSDRLRASTTARSRRAMSSARSWARASMARTLSPRRSQRGAVAVVARPAGDVSRARGTSPTTEPRRAVRGARRADSSRPIPTRSSRSPAPTARPRPSR